MAMIPPIILCLYHRLTPSSGPVLRRPLIALGLVVSLAMPLTSGDEGVGLGKMIIRTVASRSDPAHTYDSELIAIRSAIRERQPTGDQAVLIPQFHFNHFYDLSAGAYTSFPRPGPGEPDPLFPHRYRFVVLPRFAGAFVGVDDPDVTVARLAHFGFAPVKETDHYWLLERSSAP